MDAGTLEVLVNILTALGPGGILAVTLLPGFAMSLVLLLLFFVSSRKFDRLLREYRDDTQDILKQYREDQSEVVRMYENNVELVKAANKVADSLQTTVVRNTEAMTRVCDMVMCLMPGQSRGPHNGNSNGKKS